MVPLEQGEYIVKEVRRHWFFAIARAIVYVFVAILPLLGYPIASVFLPTLFTISGGSVSVFLAVYPLWLLLLWVSFFLFWTDYYLDVLVLTNERIMDIDQRGLFNREISEFRLENIQDLTIDISGFIATFLDFGDVHVQTAGKNQDFVIDDAAHPGEVKEAIADEHDRVMENLKHQERSV